jgi:hypothetical protein
VRSWEIDVTQKMEVGPAKIEELIEQVKKASQKQGGRQGLSQRGPLTDQFEGGGASLFEAVLGAWLYRAGKEAEAARVLLPAIDILYEDRHKEEVADGATWYQVRARVEALVKAKDKFGYELVKGFLASEKSADYDKATLLRVYLEHDVGKAKELAPKYLSANGEELRFTAALVVFRTGDKDKARSLLGDGIAERGMDGWTADAVAALLKEGSDESKKQAVRLFANRSLAHERNGSRARCVRLCTEAGLKEPYRFYLPLLDVNEAQLTVKTEKGEGASYFGAPVREVFAKEIVEVFGSDKAVAEIACEHPRAADQVAPLKTWLQEQLKAK